MPRSAKDSKIFLEKNIGIEDSIEAVRRQPNATYF
jgi:hypothetical protein